MICLNGGFDFHYSSIAFSSMTHFMSQEDLTLDKMVDKCLMHFVDEKTRNQRHLTRLSLSLTLILGTS